MVRKPEDNSDKNFDKSVSQAQNTKKQKDIVEKTSKLPTNGDKDLNSKVKSSPKNQDRIFYVIIGSLSVIILGLLALNFYHSSANKVASDQQNKGMIKNETLKEKGVPEENVKPSKEQAKPQANLGTTTTHNDGTENGIVSKTPSAKQPPKVKAKKIERYAIYYGIIDKNNDVDYARYDGEHFFVLKGDDKIFDTEGYIVPAESLSNVLLTKQHVYKLYFTDQDIESMTKDKNGVVNVLKKVDHVEDTSLSYVAMGVYHRNAGDEWGDKYASDVYLDLMYYTDDGAVEYVTFIPKTVASPLHLEIGRKYRIGFSFCEQEINDPDIKAYTCSNKAQVLEVK